MAPLTHVSPPKPCVRLSFPPYVLHARAFSCPLIWSWPGNWFYQPLLLVHSPCRLVITRLSFQFVLPRCIRPVLGLAVRWTQLCGTGHGASQSDCTTSNSILRIWSAGAVVSWGTQPLWNMSSLQKVWCCEWQPRVCVRNHSEAMVLRFCVPQILVLSEQRFSSPHV